MKVLMLMDNKKNPGREYLSKLIGLNIDVDIFKNGLIDIDISKNGHIDIDIFKNGHIDIDIFNISNTPT